MNPVTLITGASAGLGVEFARLLAKRGERLVLVARRRDRLSALARELGNARAIAIDLSKPDAVPTLLADLEAKDEEAATLINNAGFGLTGLFAGQQFNRLREMIDLNISALTELCRVVVPAMIARRSGAILNVASTAAFQPGPGMAVYFATKAYVLSFTEALHEELKPHGIRVSALCPGPTSTEFGEIAGFGKSLPRFVMADAKSVVEAGLAGLDRNRAVVVPGLLNRIGASGARIFPRPLVRKVAGMIKY